MARFDLNDTVRGVKGVYDSYNEFMLHYCVSGYAMGQSLGPSFEHDLMHHLKLGQRLTEKMQDAFLPYNRILREFVADMYNENLPRFMFENVEKKEILSEYYKKHYEEYSKDELYDVIQKENEKKLLQVQKNLQMVDYAWSDNQGSRFVSSVYEVLRNSQEALKTFYRNVEAQQNNAKQNNKDNEF